MDASPPPDPKAARAAAKLEAAIASGDFYGALQVYRTIIKRKIDAGAADEARSLLVSGAGLLLRAGRVLEGLDLGDMLVKAALTATGAPLTQQNVDALLAVAGGVPPGAAAAGPHAAFLLGALRWAKAAPVGPGVDAPALVASLHAAAAAACVSGGPDMYPDAARHFLEASQPDAFADMLLQWCDPVRPAAGAAAAGTAAVGGGGYGDAERDLFLARAVMQLLCLGNLHDANAVRDRFTAGLASRGLPALDTPLSRFVGFLLLTLERDARPLFVTLVDKYARALGRDASFKGYIATIGARFYGIAPPSTGMDAMMSNMMGMLGGGGGGGMPALGGGGGGGGGPPNMAALMNMLGGGGGGGGSSRGGRGR